MLTKTEFTCKACNTWRSVESRGEVIAGPRCPVCHQPMKQVKLEQTELGLFAQPKTKRRGGKASR